MTSQPYIHALRYRWLNALYDPLVAATTREKHVKAKLISCLPGNLNAVLDVASGTGTLTRAIKNSFPATRVFGVDGDEDMLERARRALSPETQGSIAYDPGLAQQLPYQNDTFDATVSSLFFHHLIIEDKFLALRECYRVTRFGGTLVIADWGRAQNWLMRVMFLLVQCLDGFRTTGDNVAGRLPALIEKAGFGSVNVAHNISTPLGTISIITALKK